MVHFFSCHSLTETLKIDVFNMVKLKFLFLFDAVFTTSINFDYNTIAGRIREHAFLNPAVCKCSACVLELHFAVHVCLWLLFFPGHLR